MLKRTAFVLCIVLSFGAYFIQSFKDNYSPLRNYGPNKEFLKSVSADFDSTRIAQIYPSRGYKKEVKVSFKEHKKELLSLDTAKLLMRNDTITKYLQGLVDKIQQKTPLLNKRNFTVFTYRTNEPNAANWGAGVVLVNLDLISKYTDEEEMVSTLCHEISHDLKEHVVSNIEERYEITHNEEFKKEWKKMKASEYNKFKQYEALITKYVTKKTK
ncbi:MAG TPA: M48 family metalloprotease, partial [Bacteroidia bacterium]